MITKLFVTTVSGFVLSPVLWAFETFVFRDWNMGIALVLVLLLDAALGFVKHWKLKTINRVGFVKFFTKLSILVGALFMIHIFKYFLIPEKMLGDFLTQGLNFTLYGMIFFWLAISIAENMLEISDGQFPPKIIVGRMRKYQETGSIEDLKNAPQQA